MTKIEKKNPYKPSLGHFKILINAASSFANSDNHGLKQ